MNILSLENIEKSYGERRLFDTASFYLQEGEKVGVIGINGTGKSTLLKIIAGSEEPDEGNITMAGNVVLSFLPQHPAFNSEETVMQAVLNKCGESSKAAEEGRDIETEAKTMLTKLGFTEFSMSCGHLSGGQRKRLALVAALLAPSDILILDEPTNHLDNEMADWLEERLRKRSGAVIMVTHDRYFLDSVSNRIIEIDKGKIYSYQTNYSGYLALKAEREESALASERKETVYIKERAGMGKAGRKGTYHQAKGKA